MAEKISRKIGTWTRRLNVAFAAVCAGFLVFGPWNWALAIGGTINLSMALLWPSTRFIRNILTERKQKALKEADEDTKPV